MKTQTKIYLIGRTQHTIPNQHTHKHSSNKYSTKKRQGIHALFVLTLKHALLFFSIGKHLFLAKFTSSLFFLFLQKLTTKPKKENIFVVVSLCRGAFVFSLFLSTTHTHANTKPHTPPTKKQNEEVSFYHKKK